MFPFVTEAYAMPPGVADGGGGALVQFIPFVLIFLIFWFLIIRPQQKKARVHRELLASLKKGDEVKTDGGIHGTIVRLAEDFATLEIANKVQIRIDRARIADRTRAKPESKSDEGEAAKESKEGKDG